VKRSPDRIAETPWRTDAAAHPRTERTGRSRVVKTRFAEIDHHLQRKHQVAAIGNSRGYKASLSGWIGSGYGCRKIPVLAFAEPVSAHVDRRAE
jgi:hypothetical protein